MKAAIPTAILASAAALLFASCGNGEKNQEKNQEPRQEKEQKHAQELEQESKNERREREKLADEFIAKLELIAETIEGVDDRVSALKAEEKISSFTGELEELKDRMRALGDPDEETEKMLNEVFKAPMMKLGRRMADYRMEMSGKEPDIVRILDDSFKKIGSVMTVR